jgi:hypothetical protein
MSLNKDGPDKRVCDSDTEALARDAILDDGDDVAPRPKARRSRLSGYYVRVPTSWFINRKGPDPFATPSTTKLWLWLLYRSNWGRFGVKVTAVCEEETGLTLHARRKALQSLERVRLCRVVRQKGCASIAWVNPLSSSELPRPRRHLLVERDGN